MQNLQQFFIDNPLWTLIISVIVAVTIAVVAYRCGKKVRKPTYYVKSHNLITDFGSKVTNLKMLYSDKQIKQLTVSKIAFWNNGRETINKTDIADAEPLIIKVPSPAIILDANVIREINPVNKFAVQKINDNEARILFDFLDKGQGGAIQIMHTGEESSNIKVDGFVKGAGNPIPSYIRGRTLKIMDKLFPSPKQNQPTKPLPAKTRRDVGILSLILALVMLIVMVFLKGSVIAKAFGFIPFSIYAWFGYILLKRRVPKGLEIVEEEEV